MASPIAVVKLSTVASFTPVPATKLPSTSTPLPTVRIASMPSVPAICASLPNQASSKS